MVKKFKATTPSNRHKISADRSLVYKGRALKSLLKAKPRGSGRGSSGRITVRHKGGGHKHHYRMIDFHRTDSDISCKVIRIEYDPNRTAYIALVVHNNGKKSYIIAQEGLKVGDVIVSSSDLFSVGSCMSLQDMPSGMEISCLESYPGGGASIARSAGAFCRLLAKENDSAVVRMMSGEVKRFSLDCKATIGRVSNIENSLYSLGKAGAKRWRGVRPTVRGVAMNPVDHPHGGGEGRTSGGRHPVTPWGQPTKGYKTRKKSKFNKNIVSFRK